jgi:hypothetical protein
LPLQNIELLPKLAKLGLNLSAQPFILYSAEKSKHRLMAAPSQPKRSLGKPPFSGFKLALCEPRMGEASPEIRSDDLTTDRLPLLVISRHVSHLVYVRRHRNWAMPAI